MFFNIPQIQYKNPWVQIMLFRNMTPSPFLRFYLGRCCRGRRACPAAPLPPRAPAGCAPAAFHGLPRWERGCCCKRAPRRQRPCAGGPASPFCPGPGALRSPPKRCTWPRAREAGVLGPCVARRYRETGPCPSLYYRESFLTDNGEQVLVDVEDKTNKEITEHVKKILGKSK